MDEELGFQTLIDTNLNDWQTRAILADWLQDRGDKRAEGYRELARTHRIADHMQLHLSGTVIFSASKGKKSWVWRYETRYTYGEQSILPRDMWNFLTGYIVKNHNKVYYNSRLEAENAFALAFALYKKPLLVVPERTTY
jgi:uncharacterized protein (TIGR02996 family)